jgi:hypothetical protein
MATDMKKSSPQNLKKPQEKKASGGDASKRQAKGASASSTQTAAARRAAEAQLTTLLTTFAPDSLRQIAALRRALRKRLPTAHEVVYEYRDCCVISVSPTEQGYDGVFAIRASADAVKLYFNQGKGLPDPGKVLQGSGGQARWIETKGAATLARPEVAALVETAIASTRVPFEAAGRGSVIVRETTASKQTQARKRT